MKGYSNIRFKEKTAQRFKEFSRTHFKTHTDAMAGMLDFFFYNEISPKEKFGPTAKTIETLLKKRINAVIAIMKDIEKNKVTPTLAILESLIEAADPKKEITRKTTLTLIFINNSLCISPSHPKIGNKLFSKYCRFCRLPGRKTRFPGLEKETRIYF